MTFLFDWLILSDDFWLILPDEMWLFQPDANSPDFWNSIQREHNNNTTTKNQQYSFRMRVDHMP